MHKRPPIPQTKPPVIKSLLDIKKVIAGFIPTQSTSSSKPNPEVHIPEPVVDEKGIKRGMKNTTITLDVTSNQTMARKCLLDGFEMVKRHLELDTHEVGDIDAYGGFVPIQPPKTTNNTWLDKMITRQLGGRREGLKVVWDVMEGQYAFDPWTGNLEKTK
jgi:hypothetical protein